MNYFHAYHAGNHADVFKHIILIQLLQYLRKKPKPFCYIDTHAGLPCYNLADKEAQTTREFHSGIAQLWAKTALPVEIRDYLTVLNAVNLIDQPLNHYLGSAGIAQQLLRPVDSAIVCDTQAHVYQQLKTYFHKIDNVHVHRQDGYQALTALTPPKEKRGLVLIDPPYEQKEDWHKPIQTIQTAIRRWPNGIYTLWFPIKDRQQVKQLINGFTQTGIPNMLLAEFCPWPIDVPHAMNGSGMIIINPPWQFDKSLRNVLPILLAQLRQHPQAYTRVSWLTEPS